MGSEKVWILGPCSMESEENFTKVHDTLVPLMSGKDWYLKASFDKANRTSLHSGRGPGMEYCLDVWKRLKASSPGIKLLTDVHEVHQVEKLAGVIDCIQIPAFLCRQTDLIVECAKHFNQINVKKGQWLGPNNLIKSVDKIKETNPDCEAWVCQRGSNFGYHELIVHFGIVDELKQYYDRVILDCTHAIQRSRTVFGTQGDRRLAERYFVAADIFGYNGVFAEVHPNPECAISDGDCQLELDKFEKLLQMAAAVGNSSRGLNVH